MAQDIESIVNESRHSSVQEDHKIIFPDGVFGFEQYKPYYIKRLSNNPSNNMFLCLSSTESNYIVFTLIDVYQLIPTYKLKLHSGSGVINPEENDIIKVYAIITILKDSYHSSVNLQGPLLINFNKSLGAQMISMIEEYNVKHPLMPILKEYQDKLNKKADNNKEEQRVIAKTRHK